MIKKSILGCDIDNTVADQLSYYKKVYNYKEKKLDPDAYSNNGLLNYKVIKNSIVSINRFSKFFKIIWISARNKENMNSTRKWLEENGFPIDDIYLVGQNDKKLNIIEKLKPDLYIDDMKYNYENLLPKPCTNFLNSLTKMTVSYEAFNNNWNEICNKYLKETK